MTEDVKFLLVDDVAANLDALEALLRRDGLTLMRANSGPEALELLLSHDFALALIDVNMPDMSGLELAEFMRGTTRTRTVPIILLTAGGGESRLFKGYEAGAVDYLEKPLDAHILCRKAEVFFELDRQRRELVRQRNEMEVSERRFRRSLMLAPTPVMLFDQSGAVLSVNDEWVRLTGLDAGRFVAVSSFAALVCGDEPERFLDSVHRLVSAGERVQIECSVKGARGATLVWEMVADEVGEGKDGRRLFVCVAHDVTERAQAERLRQLLLGELNHRVKNTLATVVAIAGQTLRQTTDPALFSRAFGGRIQALAQAHTLLSDESWKDADLGDLVSKQLELTGAGGGRLSCEGPPARLGPQVALQASLVLHELVTNAQKYGALSGPSGQVEIRWTVSGGRAELQWRESGGPRVEKPSRRGFGSVMIERGLTSLGGSAACVYDREGVRWTFALPLVSADPDVPPLSTALKKITASLAAKTSRTGALGGELRGRTVLIVEDEPLIGLQIMDDLYAEGAVVLGPAATPAEAFAILDRTKPDFALLDGNLSGYRIDAVAAALRDRGVPFAFVTGYGLESLPAEFQDVPVLAKPFDTPQLVELATSLAEAAEKRPVAARRVRVSSEPSSTGAAQIS